MPVILLHAFFLNYSVHDFTVLYASLFFSVLLGILYDKVKKSGVIPLRKMQIGIVITVVFMVAEFYIMNPPAFISPKHEQSYTEAKVMGEKIKVESRPTETVFSNIKDLSPQIIFYAQRNVKAIASHEEAIRFLNERTSLQGRMFYESASAPPNQRLRSEPITIDIF
jgi:hypothetical protein